MRIVIEIDGERVTAVSVEKPDAGMREALSRAASAVGATSAGPAPQGVDDALHVKELPVEAVEALGLEPIDAGPPAVGPPTTRKRAVSRKPSKAKRSGAGRSRKTKGRRASR